MTIRNNMYINGRWTTASGGDRREIINPATWETIDSVPVATGDDLEAALSAAEAGWKTWRKVDPWSRSAALRRIAALVRERADLSAEAITGEMGKPLREAKAEVLAAADQFDWYADEARRIYGRTVEGRGPDRRFIVFRQPVGPVAAFSPWNFPALLAARKIAPALAAGCSIIIKPDLEAPRSVFALAEACHDAGIPPGAVNVVTGDPSMISSILIGSDITRKVTFTGSVPVGAEIMKLCSDGIKPVTLELGGHSPVLVFDDADIEKTAETCALGKYRNMGQVCIAASRFLVQEASVERFTKRFVEVVGALRIGDGFDPDTDVGPLANDRRLQATREFLEDATGKGAEVRHGGRRPPDLEKGYFFEPTVMTNVDDSMMLMRDEPFCPIAPITTFTDLEDGLKKANETEFGLAGYIFTRSARTTFLASEGLETGMVGVNHLVIATPEMPFGGVKKSGFGREGGSEGIDPYTVTRYMDILL